MSIAGADPSGTVSFRNCRAAVLPYPSSVLQNIGFRASTISQKYVSSEASCNLHYIVTRKKDALVRDLLQKAATWRCEKQAFSCEASFENCKLKLCKTKLCSAFLSSSQLFSALPSSRSMEVFSPKLPLNIISTAFQFIAISLHLVIPY